MRKYRIKFLFGTFLIICGLVFVSLAQDPKRDDGLSEKGRAMYGFLGKRARKSQKNITFPLVGWAATGWIRFRQCSLVSRDLGLLFQKRKRGY